MPGWDIHVPSLSVIPVPDLPRQALLEWEGSYVGITMTDCTLRGFDTLDLGASRAICDDTRPDETVVDIDLKFAKLVFAGGYTVDVGGAPGSALAVTGDVIAAGGPSSPREATTEQEKLALAQWYRSVPLDDSHNGRTAVGAYHLHEDTIQKVTRDDNPKSSQYRTRLKQQRQTADRVTAATRWWREDQTKKNPKSPAPTMGKDEEYNGGFNTSIRFLQAVQYMMERLGLKLAPRDNEFAELMNAATHFSERVEQYRKNNPGERTAAEVMRYVSTAAGAKRLYRGAGIPVFDLETGEVVRYVRPWPLDLTRINAAYLARARRQDATSAEGVGVAGSFTDTGREAMFGLTIGLERNSGVLGVRVKEVRVSIGKSDIELSDRNGWPAPSLYDTVSDVLVGTGALQDVLKSKIAAGANSKDTRDFFQDALNAALRKIQS
ncbi:hypothetical protein Q5530_16705 [Saccharothrix sp. BKS2]|uniref:hypothetical protein n=1 Tax=Saccharothrix sp. BKS2 TaxID=3064400 RepID=UPI0039E88ABA